MMTYRNKRAQQGKPESTRLLHSVFAEAYIQLWGVRLTEPGPRTERNPLGKISQNVDSCLPQDCCIFSASQGEGLVRDHTGSAL